MQRINFLLHSIDLSLEKIKTMDIMSVITKISARHKFNLLASSRLFVPGMMLRPQLASCGVISGDNLGMKQLDIKESSPASVRVKLNRFICLQN